MANKRIGFGLTLAVDTTGGTTFVTVGNLVDGLEESEAKADTAETALLADTVKTKSKAQVDPGDVTFMVAFDPDDSSYQTLRTLHLTLSPVAPNWRISLPAGTTGAGSITTKTFFAHLTGLGRKMKLKELMVCTVTLTKTGDPGM